ncbi:MAG TPA: hypothetical protein VGB88_00430 [Alphaproteobacteria bacterium]
MSCIGKRVLLSVAMAACVVAPTGIRADSVPHTGEQSPPVLLGTSGSTQAGVVIDGIEYCYAGTLGGGVEDANGNPHILSNYHVLAHPNALFPGEPIVHPALLDNDCSTESADYVTVGHLSNYVPIKFCKAVGPLFMKCSNNTVDAAVASFEGGQVNPDGEVLDIGFIGTAAKSANLGMEVQKSGRTTGHTVGTVAAVNVTVLVCYDEPCSDPANVAQFVNQVRVDGSFSAPGDSGSLVVECVDNPPDGCDDFPAPVGLLFAGGTNTTFFNRFEDVASALAVAPLGCDSACFDAGDGGGGGGGGGKGPGGGGPPGRSSSTDLGVERAREVQERHTPELLRRRGVLGTGLAVDDSGEPVIEVYIRAPMVAMDDPIPSDLDGIQLRVIETGQIRAY